MTAVAYYNEFDPYAAAWLRNLINAGLIAPGVVDTRSIEDVRPDDLTGFTQCHFFAGIGVWSLALRNAGWDDNRRVWSASCPCQPFSAAGEGVGFADERHLWAHFYHLLREQKQRVPIVLGEQVASKFAEPWVDLVHLDLEAMGYAFGCVPFPAAGVGAPNIRDRNYWVAYSDNERPQGRVFGGIECSDKQSPWAGGVAVRGRDGKQRLIEPGAFPLVNGAAARVGRIRAYGNAINAEAARVFIQAVMHVVD